MSIFNSGYRGGKKMWNEMMAEGGKVAVRGYSRGGAVKKVAPTTKKIAPAAKLPAVVKAPKMADGGKVSKPSAPKNDYGYDEKTVKRIYGKHYDKMSEVEKNNAYVMSQSNKKWTDEEIRGIAPHPGKKLKPEDGYAKGGKVKKFEGSAKDRAQDKKLAAKRGISVAAFERSAADVKHDKQRSMKGLECGGKVMKGKR